MIELWINGVLREINGPKDMAEYLSRCFDSAYECHYFNMMNAKELASFANSNFGNTASFKCFYIAV